MTRKAQNDSTQATDKPRRGRPVGSKNRPKDERSVDRVRRPRKHQSQRSAAAHPAQEPRVQEDIQRAYFVEVDAPWTLGEAAAMLGVVLVILAIGFLLGSLI